MDQKNKARFADFRSGIIYDELALTRVYTTFLGDRMMGRETDRCVEQNEQHLQNWMTFLRKIYGIPDQDEASEKAKTDGGDRQLALNQNQLEELAVLTGRTLPMNEQQILSAIREAAELLLEAEEKQNRWKILKNVIEPVKSLFSGRDPSNNNGDQMTPMTTILLQTYQKKLAERNRRQALHID